MGSNLSKGVVFRSQNFSNKASLFIALNVFIAFGAGLFIAAFTPIMETPVLFMLFVAAIVIWLIFGTYFIRYAVMKSYEYTYNDSTFTRLDLKTGELLKFSYSQIVYHSLIQSSGRYSRITRIFIKFNDLSEIEISRPAFSNKQIDDFYNFYEVLKQKKVL